jgi:hypothetical protein
VFSDETPERLLVPFNETGDQLRVGHVFNTRWALGLLWIAIWGWSAADRGAG